MEAARERQRERFAGSERLACNGDMGVCHTLRGTGGKYGLSACWTRKGLLQAVLQRLHLMSQLHSASRTNAALNSLRQGPASLDDPTEAE